MCGITGVMAFNLVGKMHMIQLATATMALEKRGPDFQDMYHDERVGLGHRRLSIIDLSAAGHQPMWDEEKRFAIIYNGEIFNFRELRQKLEARGISFSSNSDTEVLLKLYIHEKESCLSQLNGFFAFCIYDKQEKSLFLARDRFGIKPLLYLHDEDKFLFASEMKSMVAYGLSKDLDYTSLLTYLQVNFIPAPHSIFKNVKKLLPGHFMKVSNSQIQIQSYYQIPFVREKSETNPVSYDQAKEQFKLLMEASVKRRLVADVTIGTFLSGGIDSSVVTALASRHHPNLHTFSIGFKDNRFFDETPYARLVAKKLGTDHTVFSLSTNDLYTHLYDVLNYIDEPFADSSAINVYILSKETRKYATVALSGDGADELMGGYNKHAAFLRSLNPGLREQAVVALLPLWKLMPQSRHGWLGNKVRQMQRFAEGMKLPLPDRYWRWAGYAGEDDAMTLLSEPARQQVGREYYVRREIILKSLQGKAGINDVLLADTQLVLPNDMLTKVDMMSMANSLEVRVPYLDYELVNFVYSLPYQFKINPSIRKRILQDSFRDILPVELYNRPKKGFEVPLLAWMRKEMKSLITDDLLSEEFISRQEIFHYPAIQSLKKQLFSSNPGDVHARVWGLVVFQWWWRKVMTS